MSLRPRPTAVGAVATRTPAGGTRLEQVLRAGFALRTTQDVGVYARPPSTSTPKMAADLKKALDRADNKQQIENLLKTNSLKYGGDMILLASAGKSKKGALLSLRNYDPIATWDSGFLYMAFVASFSNVVNAVNQLNIMNIAHVWLMPDGSIEPVTKESMLPWSKKYAASADRGLDVPAHMVDDNGELLPVYTPA